MAFATLCLSRLVHGFNCKSDYAIGFSKKLFNNKGMIKAFLIGFVLLFAVLLVPVLRGIFEVEPLSIVNLLIICGLSFANFIIIQVLKLIRFK